MYSFFVIVVFAVLGQSLLLQVRAHTTELLISHSVQTGEGLDTVAQAIEQYVFVTKLLPDSLETLAGTAYGTQLNALSLDRYGYALAPQWIGNGFVQYRRSMVYVRDVEQTLSDLDTANALANECGDDSFPVDPVFCSSAFDHVVFETVDSVVGEKNDTASRLENTLEKFTSYYGVNSNVPNTGIVPGIPSTLASLVGYTGSAPACSGVFEFEGVPLSCLDLFSPSGIAVLYLYRPENIQAPGTVVVVTLSVLTQIPADLEGNGNYSALTIERTLDSPTT